MRVLIAAATSREIAPLVAKLSGPVKKAPIPDRFFRERAPNMTAYAHAGHDVDVLVTGVGMVATAAWTSRVLSETRYDLGLNFGVCGSFDRALPTGSVVHVVSDCIAELGAEDGETFLPIQELGLISADEFPFVAGRLVNRVPPPIPALGALPAVHGITVNTVHGNERSIETVARRFKPQVESMEGAAFMYACAIHNLAYAQVRAVSNIIEKRNRGAWTMAEAIANLADAALNILGSV